MDLTVSNGGMPSRMQVRCGRLVLAFALAGFSLARAEPERDPQAVERELNRVAGERAELMVAVREQERELAAAWQDPRISTPEIENLRRKLADLERQAAEVRAALRQNVLALPALRERRDRLEADRKRLDDLTRRRDALNDAWQQVRPAE